MASMSAKLDEEAHNGLVSCIQVYFHMSIVTLTFDLQNQ